MLSHIRTKSKLPGAWVPALYGTFVVKGVHFIFFFFGLFAESCG